MEQEKWQSELQQKWLLSGERMDELMHHGIKIIQSDEVFSFSMDAVLLSHFVRLPRGGKIIDLGTGNGVIPLLLSTRTSAQIEGVEIQERLASMATRSVQLNRLQEQITIHHMDMKEAPVRLGYGQYDVVTCNPPYMPVTQPELAHLNKREPVAIARHELLVTMEEVVRASSELLRYGGRVAYVYHASRLAELMYTMRTYRIEPKRLRTVHPRAHLEANMVLVEGVRNGRPELKVLPPLIVYADGEQYTKEIMEIYYGKDEDNTDPSRTTSSH
ncbi:tRNA1(Val) (adenine(37)-N6)-methyltransferase [Rubeoparvulum massiliense]|uniref:tRNA1(Val) (adenine(37)-N6)-methyltransferase n=1 Tax=Rubeoparvulum massiliense TaxID=1631346 RepID=UPI00065E85F6|nr:tRNA1(Val) (adenine(37)-N6)-methyltransferase [Rubeoparvulum massiliense]